MKKMNLLMASALLAMVLTAGGLPAFAAPAEGQAAVQAPVNLNQASAEELMTLKGIGSKTAERIIAYRQEQGPFQTIDQIVMVKGIGNAKFEKLKDQITV
ncbi:MAG TPA: helix-hairpin-helix domain-containing protein [Candidatus Omnitrophota bacterium]|nr:helix-hairpin-helix domain-containing protein [Candidatus Omnitrophota bacterium]